jgi:uncharacterized protein (DUF4213/DUF364 family)
MDLLSKITPQPAEAAPFPDGNEAQADHGDAAAGSARILAEAAAVLAEIHGAALESLTIERLVVGVFFVGVKLANGQGGVAYTPPEVVRNAGRRILRGGSPMVRGMTAGAVIRGDLVHPFAEVIRLATLNALSASLFAGSRYCLDGGDDLSTMDALFIRRRVCMVGAIIPLLKRLRELDPAEVVVIDRKKETQAEAQAGYGIFAPPEQTAERLARCQTAVFTGAAVANGSIEELIDLVPPEAAIAVVGPSAGFVPEPLFRRRVALVGTAMVTDSDRALDLLAEGGGGYRLFAGCVRKLNLLNVPRLQQLGLTHF